jgi:FkbM family methyltransferase
LIQGKGMKFIVPLKLNKSIRFICDVDDWLPWQVFCNGFNLGEKNSAEIMLDCVTKNSIVFDIGANVGYYSVLFAKQAPNTKVIAFEPFSKQLNLLKQNIRINKLLNICPYKLIVSDQEKRQKIYYSGDKNTGASSLHQITSIFETVESITLDKFCDQKKVAKIDLIKIDVEGHELNVLRGMSKLLSQKRIKHVFIEILEENLARNNSCGKDINDFFKNYGYSGSFYINSEKKRYSGKGNYDLVHYEIV